VVPRRLVLPPTTYVLSVLAALRPNPRSPP